MFAQSYSEYPTVLPPDFAISLILVVNIIAVAAAFFTSIKVSRFKWLPHVITFVWLACSPVLAGILALPYVPPDESPGPGDGFVLLPVVGEVAACLFGYVLVGVVLAFRSGRGR
ncbi:hypothetical protein [Mesorhizobium sp.]|uniref:hypothetical protein n=1 Tax=Mesorhizobium sp. TaxID=1871066 RepID=UPI000FE76104|nr:hypothetical protein [Mesorhizobium sp.]RWA70255.1 MAG: hypothetical protein EOQ29_13830 [Mesorhizobium sp.]RWA86717.1 MAG: hypothetical protein EOQ30_00170 [Mesorhizobium sp.]